MKTVLALALALGLTAVPCASAAEKPEAAPVAKKDCPLCKLPGRAALFAGKPAACPANCPKLCCTGTEITFLVKGLECDQCSAKVKSTLAQLEGVKVESVSPATGHAVLKYDLAKVTPAKLSKAIATSGYKVTGQVVSFRIPGLTDDAAAGVVENALQAVPGILRIETVCHKSGAAVVAFDPAKTNREKIAGAINTTRFKVAKDG